MSSDEWSNSLLLLLLSIVYCYCSDHSIDSRNRLNLLVSCRFSSIRASPFYILPELFRSLVRQDFLKSSPNSSRISFVVISKHFFKLFEAVYYSLPDDFDLISLYFFILLYIYRRELIELCSYNI